MLPDIYIFLNQKTYCDQYKNLRSNILKSKTFSDDQGNSEKMSVAQPKNEMKWIYSLRHLSSKFPTECSKKPGA